MPLPVEKEVREELEPFNERIRKVLDKAFKDFLAKRGAGNMYKRTDSVDVFDSVIRAAMAEFNGRPGVTVFASGSTARFLFGNVLVRFKKAVRRGKGSNIATGANNDFLNPAIPFADAPSAMKVEICWKLNELGTGYRSVHVTARNGDNQLWSYELPGGQQGIIEFPQKTASPQPRRRTAMKLKDSAKTKKKNGGEAS
ncbi:hypothetical protein BRDID11004_47500 [Bradyrhizobium diazoefficiens]|uniref:Uncharacterized protein n=1 Tax=Bradyrhizobium diazoefficiens TaxID=1355477 RepID=A0A809ZW07_9BRAD|nr:hypothetical protein [Bradyrhizobium diazoefficiens]BBZ94347.1 hypothetical protein F07S3_41800 [Bradyrhizobium diazoefficiens]BCE56435.1 hypothetical protein XF5B_39470 [Bradyrhizobium diazoefficiens]